MKHPLLMACAVSVVFSQPSVDPWDSVLSVPRLDYSELEQFSVTDGVASPFWIDSHWVDRDRAELVVPRNCWPAECTPLDSGEAAMVAKAGGMGWLPQPLSGFSLPNCGSGLYLYIAVSDDGWTSDSTGDMVHLFLDQLPAQELHDSIDCRISANKALSYSTQHYQFWLGGDSAGISEVRYGHYDANLWGWDTFTIPIGDAPGILGLAAEVGQTSASARWLEVYLSWESILQLTSNPVLDNRKLGFSVGYDDVDSLAPPLRLRWLGMDPAAIDTTHAHVWGDLHCQPGMGTSQNICGMHIRAAVTRPLAKSPTERSPWYDIRGRRVQSYGLHVGTAVVVRATGDGAKAWQVRFSAK